MKSLFSVLAVLALMSPESWGSSISLFSNAAGSSCNLAIPPGGTGTFYVIAIDADHAALCDGLSGAAFTIAGVPPGWIMTMVAAAGAQVIQFSPPRDDVYVIYGTTQYGSLIPLLTVTVTPAGPVTSATLAVQHTMDPFPWSTNIFCPYVMGSGTCPADPDAACVDGGLLHVNEPGDCLVPVKPVIWSEVKRLYD